MIIKQDILLDFLRKKYFNTKIYFYNLNVGCGTLLFVPGYYNVNPFAEKFLRAIHLCTRSELCYFPLYESIYSFYRDLCCLMYFHFSHSNVYIHCIYIYLWVLSGVRTYSINLRR